jgi:hypothetical protein
VWELAEVPARKRILLQMYRDSVESCCSNARTSPVRMQSSAHLDFLRGPARFDTQRRGGEILQHALTSDLLYLRHGGRRDAR